MSADPHQSGLINRNIYLKNRRTGMRLDDVTWTALREVALREGIAPKQLYARIANRRSKDLSFTVAVRQYLMQYFRAAATEEGHAEAGHGMITFRRAA